MSKWKEDVTREVMRLNNEGQPSEEAVRRILDQWAPLTVDEAEAELDAMDEADCEPLPPAMVDAMVCNAVASTLRTFDHPLYIRDSGNGLGLVWGDGDGELWAVPPDPFYTKEFLSTLKAQCNFCREHLAANRE